MLGASPELVIVTPVYEDADVAERLFVELSNTVDNAYIVAVDDGSVALPLSAQSINLAKLNGVVLKLTRNVGHQLAIAIGLNFVASNFNGVKKIVVMDSDGEDLPGSIKTMNELMNSDDVDVVVARRRNRLETLQFKLFYLFYKFLFNLFTGRKIAFGNFSLLSEKALRRLVSMQELSIHLAACLIKSKLRVKECALDRGSRYAGKSKMNFTALALHGFKALMVFAEDVLVRVGIACTVVAVLAVLGALSAIGLKLLGFATPGWFSVALGILLLVFLQTGALTLMTLMLSGVVRGGNSVASDLAAFIEKVEYSQVEKNEKQ